MCSKIATLCYFSKRPLSKYRHRYNLSLSSSKWIDVELLRYKTSKLDINSLKIYSNFKYWLTQYLKIMVRKCLVIFRSQVFGLLVYLS